MNQNDLQEIISLTNLEVKKISQYTRTTLYILDASNQKYILKYMNKKSLGIYEYLESRQADILYPIKKIEFNGSMLYLFKYLVNTSDGVTSLNKMKESLSKVHDVTKKEVVLKKENFKNLYKIYQVLDSRFSNLEMLVRQIEMSSFKDDNSWIVLSKYRIYLLAKNTMYSLQKKIHKAIDDGESVVYGINHASPSLSHFKGDKLINYNNGFFGFIVSDIAKFYVENDHLDTNLFKLIDGWLKKYENPLYKIYFKFLVLYIYIINLNLTDLKSYEQVNNYIKIAERIKQTIYLFKDYK